VPVAKSENDGMKKPGQPLWGGKTAVFARKQAAYALYFRAPCEKGAGLPLSGRRPAPARCGGAAPFFFNPRYAAFRPPNFHLTTAKTCSPLDSMYLLVPFKLCDILKVRHRVTR
jgi:hypothetical protein